MWATSDPRQYNENERSHIMAATVDSRPTGDSFPFNDAAAVQRVVYDIDFSATGKSLAQNETMAIANLVAGDIILAAAIEVVTADADVTDVDLGYSTDGSTNAALIDGVTLDATGYVFTAGIAAAIPITAANQLVITNKDPDTCATAVIKVILLVSSGAGD